MTNISTLAGLPVGQTIKHVDVTAVRYEESRAGELRRFAQIYQGNSVSWGSLPPDDEDDLGAGTRIEWDSGDFPDAPIGQVSRSLVRFEVRPDSVEVTARVREDGAFSFLHNGEHRLKPVRVDPSSVKCTMEFARSGAEFIDVEHVASARSLRLIVRITGTEPVRAITTKPVEPDVLDAPRGLIREQWWYIRSTKTVEQRKVCSAVAAWLSTHPDAPITERTVADVKKAVAHVHKRPWDPLTRACETLYKRSDDDWSGALRSLRLDRYFVDAGASVRDEPLAGAPGRVIHQVTQQPLELLAVVRRLIDCGVLRPGIEFEGCS